ncbi:MAG: Nif11-like leader peptide family RiPP precursor [Ruminiclostridium sp.]|nr:Nif11-like leader peptide family RiPP precursor [Ruminiclostridium sp.]
MKSAKELFERLKTDEAFAKEFSEALTAKREAGAKSVYETFIPAAAERGYELSKEELDEVINTQESELSPEELGKVAGGTSCWLAVATISVGGLILSVSIKVLDDNPAERAEDD